MRTRALPYLLIAPASLLLAVLFLWPLAQTALLAFRAPGPLGTDVWSLAHLTRMTSDLNFGDALGNTLELVAVVVPLQFLLALGMASMLRHIRTGRSLVLWIWSIPLGISDLAAGLVWLAILSERGYLNTVLHALGFIAGPRSWLTYETPGMLFAAVVFAELWRATAIVLVILVAGLDMIPREYAEAAEVFGATPWQRFLRVTLPLLRPSIQTALILRTVLAFEMFATVVAIGGRNFPILASEAYNWQYFEQNSGVAAAYALVIMGSAIGATLVYLRLLRSPELPR
jgi:multiple sugar transport system permease protein